MIGELAQLCSEVDMVQGFKRFLLLRRKERYPKKGPRLLYVVARTRGICRPQAVLSVAQLDTATAPRLFSFFSLFSRTSHATHSEAVG